MKVPGLAWIEFRVEPRGPARSFLTQTAIFAPRGLSGLLYWYALYPVHALIFSGLIRSLARRAQTASGPSPGERWSQEPPDGNA